MEGLRKGKGIYFLIGTIVTFGILMSGNLATAQDDLNIFAATLLQGQGTGNQSFSSTTSFGLATIAVTSIGNKTLSSSLTVTSGQSWLWTVFLFGTGGGSPLGLSVGVSPFTGKSAVVDVNNGLSFGFAIGYILTLEPVSSDAPLKWNMSVSGS